MERVSFVSAQHFYISVVRQVLCELFDLRQFDVPESSKLTSGLLDIPAFFYLQAFLSFVSYAETQNGFESSSSADHCDIFVNLFVLGRNRSQMTSMWYFYLRQFPYFSFQENGVRGLYDSELSLKHQRTVICPPSYAVAGLI